MKFVEILKHNLLSPIVKSGNLLNIFTIVIAAS